MSKLIERVGFELRLLRAEKPEKLWTWLAWRVPGSLAYWCAMRVASRTLAPDEHPDEQTVPQMLARWHALPGSSCGWCGRQHVGRCAAYREQVEQT